jgi:hypothetical protein
MKLKEINVYSARITYRHFKFIKLGKLLFLFFKISR